MITNQTKVPSNLYYAVTLYTKGLLFNFSNKKSNIFLTICTQNKTARGTKLFSISKVMPLKE